MKQEKFIKSFDGTKIYYYDNNAKSQKAVVFLHGWLGNRTHWQKHIDYFNKKKYRIIAPDLRGFGKSDKFIQTCYSFTNNAKDINLILEKEKINEINLAGFSMGGMISLVFYDMYPKKVKKMALCQTTYKGHQSKEVQNTLMNFVHISKNNCHSKKEGKMKINKLVDFSKDKFYLATTKVALEETHPSVILEYLKYIFDFDATNVLQKIKVPTIIIAGRQDALIPYKFSVQMKRKIKDAKLISVNFGHSFTVKDGTAPKIICDFFEGNRK